jgi:hypothetical protein
MMKLFHPSSSQNVVLIQFLVLIVSIACASRKVVSFTPFGVLHGSNANIARVSSVVEMKASAINSGGCGDSAVPHPSTLPGDPSLLMVTNLDLGEKKMEVMKSISKSIAQHTGKPEAYIGKICYPTFLKY